MMALQIRHLKPRAVKLLVLSSRPSVTQAEPVKDNWKTWTENHVSLLQEVTQQQLAEAEKVFSNNAAALENLLSKSQKLVFGHDYITKKKGIKTDDSQHVSKRAKANTSVSKTTPSQNLPVLSVNKVTFDKLDPSLDGEILDKLFGIEKDLQTVNGSQVDITGSGMEQGNTDFWKSEIHRVNLNIPNIDRYNNIGNSSAMGYVCASRNIENEGILYCSHQDGFPSPRNTDSNKPNNKHNKPNLDQLMGTQTIIHEMVPTILHQTPPSVYSVFTPDVIFENNFFSKPYTTVGIAKYASKILKYRLLSAMMYSKREVYILKSTVQEKEGTIRLRWRILALPSWKILLTPWRFTLFKFSQNISDQSRFFDGLSTFYVDGNGQIYKHRIDKLMPDEELDKLKIPKSLADLLKLTPKLAPSDATPTA